MLQGLTRIQSTKSKLRALLGCCSSALQIIASILGSAVLVNAEDDWPQWRGANRDGVWRERRIVGKLDKDSVEFLWRAPLGAGYTGPTVADDRVYVMDRQTEPEQKERIVCFDAVLGKQLWVHEYACEYRGIGYVAGPRASVTIDDNNAYALGAMGHLHCLDAGSGTVLWKRDLNEEYELSAINGGSNRMPNWGLAASPLIYNDLVIVHPGGSEGRSVVAFDKDTGEEEWRALSDRAQYSAPILIRQAGRDVIVIWTGDSVAGLAPDSGDVYWRFPFAPSQMPIGIATPVIADNQLFVSSFYDGSLMLNLSPRRMEVEKVWQQKGESETRTRALHSMMSTPILKNGYIYGVDSHGELRCLEAATGKRVWEDQTAVPKSRWSNIHMVQREDQVWMFTERGDLIQAELSPQGFEEIGRVHIIDPTTAQLRRRGGVCWSHPAFANRCVFARNDKEIVCVSLED